MSEKQELHKFLEAKADEIAPLHRDYPDCRQYAVSENDDALTDAWLENRTSYIWRVGVLAQWDSNKCDWMRLFIGHERNPDQLEFIGCLYWQDGENDDVGASMSRALRLAADIHPTFADD